MRTTVLAAFLLALALSCLPRPVAATADFVGDGTPMLVRMLTGVEGSCDAGVQIRRPDLRLDIIKELGEIGTPEAIGGLHDLLVQPDACALLKMHALLALARNGNAEAVRAIGWFELWAENNRETPPPFTFGPKVSAIYYERPTNVWPVGTATDPGGTEWAIFRWDRFCGRYDPSGDWWITKSPDGIHWDQPLLVKDVGEMAPPQVDEAERFLTEVRLGKRALDAFTLDSDWDGLTDLLESRVGTDPKVADSDGDTVPDGRDGNPLTPAGQVSGDEEEIRQAVFTFLFAAAGSEDPIYLVDRGEFARQEYLGHRGLVLPVPELQPGRVNVVEFNVSMESATSAKASIMHGQWAEAISNHTLSLQKLHDHWVVVESELRITM